MDDAGRQLDHRVTVVGGGITGLAAALELAAAGARVTLREESPRLGGHLRTSPFAGRDAVDEAADAFLARVPEGSALARAVGLGDELVEPAATSAFVWFEGLHDIPAGTVLGIPGDVRSLLTTSLLSPRAKARALAEPFRRRTTPHDSLGALVRHRFGTQVHDRLVDSLVGSIYAADTNRLSLSMVPQLDALAQVRGGMLRGARKALAAVSPGPMFFSTAGGMGALADATAAAARSHGATIGAGDAVEEIAADGSRWRVDGEPADAVILACPAGAAAAVLNGRTPAFASTLTELDTADVVIITLAIDATTWPAHLRNRSGYLVPKSVQQGVTAVSFATQKWAHLADGASEILRISLGRDGLPLTGFADDELLATAVAEVSRHLGFEIVPTAVRISRWPRSFPQYRPGHRGWLTRLDAACPAGLALAGASYRGIGVPACIADAQRAARVTLAHLGARA